MSIKKKGLKIIDYELYNGAPMVWQIVVKQKIGAL